MPNATSEPTTKPAASVNPSIHGDFEFIVGAVYSLYYT
jgi:hypothetical protein